MKKNLFFIFLGMMIMAIWSMKIYALSVDEKLPVRIIETSDSKKTVLINRGVEDGLVVGDHAKFFNLNGVLARGVVIKTSPTRSVWAIYNLSEAGEIEKEKLMNLKITTAVKLTEDPSKTMQMFDFHETEKQKIVLTEGPTDFKNVYTNDEKQKLQEIQTSLQEGYIYPYLTDKTAEVWGTLHLNAMTSTNSVSSDGQGSSGDEKQMSGMIGFEKYFRSQERWYSRFSISPFFEYGYAKSTSLEGHKVGNSHTGGGLALSYHFLNSPLMQGKPLLFVMGSYGMGVSEDYKELNNVTNDKPANLKGNYNSFSVGGGLKYYFGYGLGLRAILDYYQRGESYKVGESNDPYSKKVKGPRFLVGISARW